jgi:hypothetical protein
VPTDIPASTPTLAAMKIVSTIVLFLGCLALTVAATPALPRLFDKPPSVLHKPLPSAPQRYHDMFNRATGYVKPLPSAPPLPKTQPPPKGSLHRAYGMPKLPPAFQTMVAQKYSKKRKYGMMMNGN